VATGDAPLKYLLTYKLSQDHIELFFGAIWASCGCNNNPTVRQFIAAYKRLLMRHNVAGGIGNCTVQDATNMLSVTANSVASNDTGLQQDSLDVCIGRLYALSGQPSIVHDHAYVELPSKTTLTNYKTAVVSYIAGYVVKMVRRKISCLECQSALTDDVAVPTAVGSEVGSQFMALKNRGGLVKASPSVILVCQETEKCFQRMCVVTANMSPQTGRILPSICTAVLTEVGLTSFPSLTDHMFDTTPDSNHVFNLVKCVAHCYGTIRMHHLAKQKTVEVTGAKVCKQLTKLVLFKHQ